MNHDQHNLQMGRLIGNLGSLEFVLRLFLSEASGQKAEIPKPGQATVPLSYLTGWDSLDALVGKYNARLSASEAKTFRVADEVATLRDALGHSRVLSPTPLPPLTLYRFGKPMPGGVVPVEWVAVLDEAWFNGRIQLIHSQVTKVVGCARARNYKAFPDD